MANRWLQLSDEEINALREMFVDYYREEMAGGSPAEDKARASAIKKFDKVQKRIKIASAKGKGRSLQQAVCRVIADTIGINYDQADDGCLIHSREMGQAGIDVILRGEAQGKFPFAVECKSSEGMSVQAFVQQAQSNTKKDLDWMVVYKGKAFSTPVVILDFNVFCGIWGKLLKMGGINEN